MCPSTTSTPASTIQVRNYISGVIDKLVELPSQNTHTPEFCKRKLTCLSAFCNILNFNTNLVHAAANSVGCRCRGSRFRCSRNGCRTLAHITQWRTQKVPALE